MGIEGIIGVSVCLTYFPLLIPADTLKASTQEELPWHDFFGSNILAIFMASSLINESVSTVPSLARSHNLVVKASSDIRSLGFLNFLFELLHQKTHDEIGITGFFEHGTSPHR